VAADPAGLPFRHDRRRGGEGAMAPRREATLMTWRVLVCDEFPADALEALRQAGFEVAYAPGVARDALLREVRAADVLVARASTPVDREVLDAAPRLKAVAMPGTGLDHIDLAACAQRGVRVVSAPGANTESVAELTLGLMIEVARHLPEAEAHTAAGGWDKRRFMGEELAGQTLGLVGRGRIGSRVAELAQAFRMTVLASDPAVPGSPALDDVLRAADYVSLHVPLLPATRHLIGARELALLRPGAVLLNLSRGGIVDEAALAGRSDITYVADVLEDEPRPGGRLAPRPFRLTPHIGAWTRQAQRRAAFDVVDRIRGFRKEWSDGHGG
jgi:D-3-phosphoglycerate dehydrogenase